MDKVTAGRDAMSKFAPKFAELNDDVLFGEVWSREDKLSPRDRSLITVSALMASGILDTSLLHHIERAKVNGVTATEMSEALTQLAFLCWLAQGVGGSADGKRCLWRGIRWSALLLCAICSLLWTERLTVRFSVCLKQFRR